VKGVNCNGEGQAVHGQLADLLRQKMANTTGYLSVYKLTLALNVSFQQLTSFVRSLPAEFGLYHQTQNKRSAQYVKYYAAPAGAQVCSRQVPKLHNEPSEKPSNRHADGFM
jgi:hypothetical protein